VVGSGDIAPRVPNVDTGCTGVDSSTYSPLYHRYTTGLLSPAAATDPSSRLEVLKLWGVLPREAPSVLGGGGASCLYEGHIYLDEIWTQDKIYILVVTLLGRNILLTTYLLVPVLDPNYKQHILSPAEVSFLSL
jgi:hypothetical protein